MSIGLRPIFRDRDETYDRRLRLAFVLIGLGFAVILYGGTWLAFTLRGR